MTDFLLPLPSSQPGWSVIKSPRFSNRIQRAANGRALTVLDQLYPIWSFTLTIDLLRAFDRRGTFTNGFSQDLRTLADFWLARRGRFGTFFYDDPTDGFAVNTIIDVGNGVRTQFQLYRVFGSEFVEPVTAPNTVSAIFLNGVSLPALGNWTIDASKGLINFITAPGSGVVITASFTFYFRCRFTEDNQDFENFLMGYWKVGQLKFESVLL